MNLNRSLVRQTTSWKRRAGIILAMLGWLFCVAHSIYRNTMPFSGVDFRAIYASSRCVIDKCDPYSESETMAEFLHQGGTLREAGPAIDGPFSPNYAGYPPMILLYLVPVALLPWPLALYVWLVLSVLLYGLAVFLFADLCADESSIAANTCLAVFLALGSIALEVANPSVPAAGLCCIAVWCFLTERYERTGVALFAVSLILKPHLGLLVLIYFLVTKASYRKRALQVIATTVLLCVPVMVWFTVQPSTKHWYSEYNAALKGISARGFLSDPGPTNGTAFRLADLQTIVSVVKDDPAFYNPVVWAICLLVLVVWIVLVRRLQSGRASDLLSLAAISAFTLLPVYHRSGDARLLLLTFPALAILVRNSRLWGTLGIVLSVLMAAMTSDSYLSLARKYWLPIPKRLLGTVWDGRLYLILFERQVALICLVTTLFYMTIMWRASKRHLQSAPEESFDADQSTFQHSQ